jgi:hypothetical protein
VGSYLLPTYRYDLKTDLKGLLEDVLAAVRCPAVAGSHLCRTEDRMNWWRGDGHCKLLSQCEVTNKETATLEGLFSSAPFCVDGRR